MKNPSYLLVSSALIFACMVLSISLVSASSATNQINELPNSSREIKFTQQIIPGHALYPLVVMKDKIRLTMLDVTDQCLERVILASDRLDQALMLINNGDTSVAIETLRKGQKYLAEASRQCQDENLPEEYKAHIIEITKQYREALLFHKGSFSDHQRVVVDQLIAENEAMLSHLGE